MPRPSDQAREQARARGDTRYISVRPCPQGHFERFVASSGCYVCQTIRQGSTPKKPKQPKPHRVSAKNHAENIEADKTRFKRQKIEQEI
ncbi:MAG: hypothetical protein JWO19_6125, partial [Bryobacterales bacterium]|nr:hypothetical protein [Bryobacterales bacterium]